MSERVVVRFEIEDGIGVRAIAYGAAA